MTNEEWKQFMFPIKILNWKKKVLITVVGFLELNNEHVQF